MALAALTLLSTFPLTLLPHRADAQAASVLPITAGVTLPGAIPPLVQTSTLQGPLPGTQPISLALALPLRNQEALGHLLQGLYDANSPEHGHFLTTQQFADAYAPTQADYDAVIAYARSRGLQVTGTYPNRLLLDVTADADVVQNAFGVHLLRYLSPTGRAFYAPDANPVIDPTMAGKLSGVIGLDNAAVAHPAAIQMPAGSGTSPAAGTGVGGGLSPSDIKNAYNLNTNLNGSGQTLGLIEADGYNAADIAAYESHYSLPSVPLSNISIDGASYSSSSSAEATLDVELQVALAPAASRIYVYNAPNNDTGFVDAYDHIASDDFAKQISSSWYISEPDVSAQRVSAENQAFEEMACQGQTMYAASGDNGAYTKNFSPPQTFNGISVYDPASQPYVCAVGGTSLTTSTPGGPYASETTWNDGSGSSGGGISSIWPQPAWQSQPGVVSNASGGSYNYRNLPDVSLDADPNTGYSIYYNGGWYIYGGTSCAAPLWAACTALVNQQRAQNGLNLLGLADPYIYQIGRSTRYADDFHDITTGNNNHYSAVTDYDDATGWGSFNGVNLLDDLTTIAAPATTPVPFYRMTIHPSSTDGHFYTTDITEEHNAMVAGWGYEAIIGHTYANATDAPNLVPFFRCYSPNSGDFLYTMYQSEYNSALAHGYQANGIQCYVFPDSSTPGTVPLYRAFGPGSGGTHLYTTSLSEYNQLGTQGFTLDGIVCYILR